MKFETVIYEKKDGVGVITFNRPDRKNALSVKMLSELPQAADAAEKDDEVAVVVLTGGPKTFSAGAELSEITPEGLPPAEGTGAGVFEAVASIAAITKPVIAAINGPCVAGALALALACDIRIAAESAKIGDGHMKIKVLGDTIWLPRIINPSHAKVLIFTGDLINGKEACRVGLVDYVYPDDKFLDEAMSLAGRMAEHGLNALRINKKAVDWGLRMDVDNSWRFSKICNLELLATGEFKERVAAFFAKKW